jgi:hypothetical protein
VITPFAKVDPDKDLKDEHFVVMTEADAAVQALCESRSMLKFNVC